MVFSSYWFLFFFLPVALGLYYAVPRRFRHLTLTLLSYLFYGWANPAFVLLMLGVTAVDYANGCGMAAFPRRKRVFLIASLGFDLAVLGFFKYFNFGVENYNALLGALGIPEWQFAGFFRIVLPLGISFYIFQSMSYVIDVYRNQARPVRNFVDYACFVSMFPQLVAGPIIRFQEVADQLAARTHTWEKFGRGVAFFMLGLGKKVLLANPCGRIADVTFGTGDPGCWEAWHGVVAYAFQIYFDFSGYSDMAIGLGLLFGFVFAKNFDSPYRAHSITEFWQRWHLSLSTWLRDYLYIPLGGNRKGAVRTYVNLIVVMLAGGLWHGAGWNFLLWGGMQGGYLAVERGLGKRSFYARWPGAVRMALTFLLLLPTWVLFRTDTLTEAWRYGRCLAGFGAGHPAAAVVGAVIDAPYYWVNFGLAAVVVWGAPTTWDFTRVLNWPKIVWCFAVFALALAALTMQNYNPFIYFIF